jgi:hypothetical protein
MRKQDAPGISKPVVEFDFAFGGFRLEIGGGVANRQCHDKPPNDGRRVFGIANFEYLDRTLYLFAKGGEAKSSNLS